MTTARCGIRPIQLGVDDRLVDLALFPDSVSIVSTSERAHDAEFLEFPHVVPPGQCDEDYSRFRSTDTDEHRHRLDTRVSVSTTRGVDSRVPSIAEYAKIRT